MADIIFKRTGEYPSGSVAGVLEICAQKWPTIERGGGFTFVRMGTYELKMDTKKTGRKVHCLRFHEDDAISTHLIHDAWKDDAGHLQGCIAPGLSKNEKGIQSSAEAMRQVFLALGGFSPGCTVTIEVQNNIGSNCETKEQWMGRRKSEGKGKH